MGHVEQQLVSIPAGLVWLEGNLGVPSGARGVVLFVHGSGSSRHSPRNRYVAEQLQRAGMATLLMDLLSIEEEAEDRTSGHLRFDIPMLAQRVGLVTDWLRQNSSTSEMKIGYFGASTGAGAALLSAADRPGEIGAIVSRGGRPDLAGNALQRVTAPTLLIVGGNDEPVIRLNQVAMEKMHAEKKLEVIPDATHLFEEPGTLEQVARLAQGWFGRYLIPAAES